MGIRVSDVNTPIARAHEVHQPPHAKTTICHRPKIAVCDTSACSLRRKVHADVSQTAILKRRHGDHRTSARSSSATTPTPATGRDEPTHHVILTIPPMNTPSWAGQRSNSQASTANCPHRAREPASPRPTGPIMLNYMALVSGEADMVFNMMDDEENGRSELGHAAVRW